MTIAIAIVGGLAILCHIMSLSCFAGVESDGGHGGSGAIGVGFLGFFLYALGYLLAIGLFVLALISSGGTAIIALLGGAAVSSPILMLLYTLVSRGETKTLLILVFATANLISLYILALAK